MARLPAKDNKKPGKKVAGGGNPGNKGTGVKKPGKKANADFTNLDKLKEAVSVLERVLLKMLDFYEGRKELDAGTRKMWSGDAKEAFYSVAACWEMLNRAAGGPAEGLGRWSDPGVAEGLRKMVGETKDYKTAARHFARYSKSCHAQAASELPSFKDEASTILEVEWKRAFELCSSIISDELKKYPEPAMPSSKRINKISDTEYELPCSVCGKIAVRVSVKADKMLTSGKPGLIYEGITCGKDIGIDNAKQLFDNFDHDDLASAHKMALKNTWLDEGIDAYCPQCDRIYCHEHYNVVDIFDDGFYDYAEGTCPKGHRRMIDD